MMKKYKKDCQMFIQQLARMLTTVLAVLFRFLKEFFAQVCNNGEAIGMISLPTFIEIDQQSTTGDEVQPDQADDWTSKQSEKQSE